jgi:hypothetical protein
MGLLRSPEQTATAGEPYLSGNISIAIALPPHKFAKISSILLPTLGCEIASETDAND